MGLARCGLGCDENEAGACSWLVVGRRALLILLSGLFILFFFPR